MWFCCKYYTYKYRLLQRQFILHPSGCSKGSILRVCEGHIRHKKKSLILMSEPFFFNELKPLLWITPRPCSYGQKLSRLARKHFEEFTSEISPCYENNMKSYIVFIWNRTFPVCRDLACWQARSRSTGKFFSHMNTTFPLSGKTSCLQLYKIMSQRETLPGKRDNISPYEQNKIIWLVEMFSR